MEVVPEGGSLFEHNMTMIADGHTTIEHSLPVAKIYDDVLQYWKGSGTAYTPTMVVTFGGPFGENYWYQHTDVWKEPILSRWVPRPLLDARSRRPVKNPPEEDNLLSNAAVAKQVSDLGIPVSIGAHGQREGLGAHWDIWSFVLGGMSTMEALRDRHDQPGARARPRQGSRQPRAGQARRPRHPRHQPARKHPQLDQRQHDHGRRPVARFEPDDHRRRQRMR